MQKITPTARIWCYPLASLGRWRKRSFSLTDRLSSLNRGASNDGTAAGGVIGFSGQTSQPEAAAQGGEISDITDLEWVKLDDELDKTYLSGFVARPRYCPLNSIIDDKVNPPDDKMCLRWDGSHDHWTTCLPDAEPAATGIRWHNTTFDLAPWARTTKSLPQGQDFRVRLWLDGIAKSPPGEDKRASFRLVMGGTGGQYSLYWVDGLSCHLSRLQNEAGSATPIYKALRQADFLNGFWGGSPIEFDVRHIAGRLYFVGDGGNTPTRTASAGRRAPMPSR